MHPHYHINIFFSHEDGYWIADFPDFLMCSASGDTPEEALHEALIARDLLIESMLEAGKPLPEAKYRPPTERAAS
jgi:predicted RNase H-like HicB family nuclease